METEPRPISSSGNLGRPNEPTARDANGINWFEQVWFSGNHSDVGGSYCENERRLSDIALDWMLRWAVAIPDGLKFDPRVLSMWPHPEGPQHDEVASGFSFIPKWTGITWTKENRKLPASAATMHRSVYRRFDLKAVQVYDRMSRYRPETLSTHHDLKSFYDRAAPFPAKSEQRPRRENYRRYQGLAHEPLSPVGGGSHRKSPITIESLRRA